ncbi:hypothetical protein K6V78_03700 [Streptococcus gallolyticus]|nr:hypothetical protein [Streptococcus gallolyticus]MBY5040676.1 hypothetical protein [Streptococcus gallolyticus]
MIDGVIQLFLSLSQNKIYRRLGLVLLIYLVSSSLILFQEILYNDRALGILGFISLFFSAENGTLLRFSYEVNFWSVVFSQIFLFVIIMLSFKWLSNKFLYDLCVIYVNKTADMIEIKIKENETLRFTVKYSDFKLSVLFILSFDILVQLCIVYFWIYSNKLSVMYLNIIIFIALLTVYSSIYFYFFLNKYVKEFFVQNMFNDVEKYSVLHDIFKQYILYKEVKMNFEDYNLDIKQAIELGIIIPIEKISYKDFKELGSIKVYVNEESVKAYKLKMINI